VSLHVAGVTNSEKLGPNAGNVTSLNVRQATTTDLPSGSSSLAST
jgi:hypothetical protein